MASRYCSESLASQMDVMSFAIAVIHFLLKSDLIKTNLFPSGKHTEL